MKYAEVERRCSYCGQGMFQLAAGSDYMWFCDHCHRCGHLRVDDAKQFHRDKRKNELGVVESDKATGPDLH
jgi:hypothetical protein